MSSANKRKGTAWESMVRDYANSRGHKAYRPAQVNAGDIGDVHVDGLLCIQAKDHATHRFGEWLQDAHDQSLRAGFPFAAVVAKRRRAAVGEAYAVLELSTLLALVKRLSIAETFLSADGHAGALYRRAIEGEQL